MSNHNEFDSTGWENLNHEALMATDGSVLVWMINDLAGQGTPSALKLLSIVTAEVARRLEVAA